MQLGDAGNNTESNESDRLIAQTKRVKIVDQIVFVFAVLESCFKDTIGFSRWSFSFDMVAAFLLIHARRSRAHRR